MSENTPRIFTVSELTTQLKGLLESAFRCVWVRGEISEYNAHSASGHVYLSIKDSRSQIRAVYFRGASRCQAMGLAVGSEIELSGRITVYEPQGAYQIQADMVRPVGVGSLRQQFEMMRERLRAEGLFDADRKRPIPAFPNCVGVITSRDGAALQDFLNVLGRRHSGLNVRIFPTLVQGKDAAQRMANAIAYVNQYHLCDVIVLTRGGGSLEDLWPFNEEVLARAIAASEIPLISAVGHERDFSISDFVADWRCATPSVAAEQVIAAKEQLQTRVDVAVRRMGDILQYRQSEAHRRFNAAMACPFLRNPRDVVDRAQQRVDMLTTQLQLQLPRRAAAASQYLESLKYRLGSVLPGCAAQLRYRLELAGGRLHAASQGMLLAPQERLKRAAFGLQALSPKNVLGRGYAILMNQEGRALRCPEDAQDGERVHALLGQGTLDAVVTKSK